MTNTRAMTLLSKRPRKKEYVCYYENDGYTYAWAVKNVRRLKKYCRTFIWYERSLMSGESLYIRSVGIFWKEADWEFCPLDKYDVINRLKILK